LDCVLKINQPLHDSGKFQEADKNLSKYELFLENEPAYCLLYGLNSYNLGNRLLYGAGIYKKDLYLKAKIFLTNYCKKSIQTAKISSTLRDIENKISLKKTAAKPKITAIPPVLTTKQPPIKENKAIKNKESFSKHIKTEVSFWKFPLRSAVIPGWGQIKKGGTKNVIRGIVYLTGILGAGYLSFDLQKKADDKLDEHNAAATDEQARSLLKEADSLSGKSAVYKNIALRLYLTNLVDASILGLKK